jgi:hypothetical protein
MVQIGNLRYDNIIRFGDLEVHGCCNEAEVIALKRRSGVKCILSCATCPQNFAVRPTANLISGLRTLACPLSRIAPIRRLWVLIALIPFAQIDVALAPKTSYRCSQGRQQRSTFSEL